MFLTVNKYDDICAKYREEAQNYLKTHDLEADLSPVLNAMETSVHEEIRPLAENDITTYICHWIDEVYKFCKDNGDDIKPYLQQMMSSGEKGEISCKKRQGMAEILLFWLRRLEPTDRPFGFVGGDCPKTQMVQNFLPLVMGK